MTKPITLTINGMAHGGAAVGRRNGRPIFVPYAIPGETARVQIREQKRHFSRATLQKVLKASPDRTEPRCQHFGKCGGCHFQHMKYARQLRAKEAVVLDQLKRIGKIKRVNLLPALAHPTPWEYRHMMEFSPVPDGGLGFWAPSERKVIPIKECPVMQPALFGLLGDVDLDLPGLRKLTLRRGSDGDLLAAMEVEGVEAPELLVDFPLSVALVLPDKTAVSLIGNPTISYTVKGQSLRVSPGCFFQPSIAGAEMIVDAMLKLADLNGSETVLDAYSGMGMLTHFLADKAKAVHAIEKNRDGVADTAVNLSHTDNVSLYEGFVEDILPMLDFQIDLAVVNPSAKGLTPHALQMLIAKKPTKIIYVSSEIATLARDGNQFIQAGYKLNAIQPVDVLPHAFQVDTLSAWSLS